MGTVSFEPTNIKNTRFFRATYDSVGAGATVSLVNGFGLSQVEMYNNEESKLQSEVRFRSYEFYIDETDDETPTQVQRLAKVTTDSTKTVDDGFDLYVSVEPTSNPTVSTIDFTFKNLHTSTQDYVLVVVGEDY